MQGQHRERATLAEREDVTNRVDQQADEPFADHQPILLTTGADNPNAADALFLVDGAEPGDLGGYRRCVILFDGGDEGQLRNARVQWTAIKARGLPASYWKQMDRGWEKQA